MTTSIFFFVSLFGMLILMGLKVFELKVRKIEFISKKFVQGDAKLHRMIELAVFKYHNYKKIAGLFLFDFLPCLTYEILVKLKDYVAKKYYNAGDGFRGRRILRSDGSVSAFLERLSEKQVDSANHKI